MAIRSMAPKVIVADEIGSYEDAEAIKYAMCCGVKGIFTAHGSDMKSILCNPALENLIKNNIFEKIIFITKRDKKHIYTKVYSAFGENLEYKLCV